MFSRANDWKLEGSPIASYYRMSDLPKKLQTKIKIDFDMENVILFSSKTEFWPKNRQLDLSKSKFRDRYKGIIFYRNSSLNLEMPFKYLPSPSSPVIIGSFRLKISIGDQAGSSTTGSRDIGAIRLVETIFENHVEISQLNDSFVHVFVQEMLDNERKTIFKGMSNDNFRKVRGQLEEQAKNKMRELLGEYGLHLKSIEIKYKMTEEEKNESRKSSLEIGLENFEIETREGALAAAKGDSKLQAVLSEKEQIRIAKELVKRGKHRSESAEIDRKTELDRVELEAGIDLEILEMESEIEKIEILERGTKITHQGSIDRIKDKQAIKKENIKLEHRIKQDDLQRKVEAALEMQSGGISVDLQRDILDIGGKKYDFTEIINPDLEKRINNGNILASHADDYIEGLEIKLKDTSNSNEKLSDIYAGLAIFHRMRGNKDGNMNDAIKNSLLLNKNNPMALKVELDYLKKKRPQMFHPQKLDRFKKELTELEAIAGKIMNIEYFDKDTMDEIKKTHIKTLEVLAHDEVLGEHYNQKLRDEYYLDI